MKHLGKKFWDNACQPALDRVFKANFLARYLMYGGVLFGNEDYMEKNSLPSLNTVKQTFNSVINAKTVLSFIYVNIAIDNISDSISSDQVLEVCGFGSGVAKRFLSSNKLCPDEHKKGLAVLDALGVMKYNLGEAFSELMATKLYERALLENKYRSEKSSETRTQITRSNMDVMHAFSSMVFQQFCSSDRLEKHIGNKKAEIKLTSNDISRVYPNITVISEAMEVCDDLRDLLLDFHYELTTGNVVTNSIISKMDEMGLLLNDQGNIKSDFRTFVMDTASSKTPLNIGELPHQMQEAIIEVHKEYLAGLEKIGRFPRAYMKAYWKACLEDGFFSAHNPSFVAHDEKKKNTLERGLRKISRKHDILFGLSSKHPKHNLSL